MTLSVPLSFGVPDSDLVEFGALPEVTGRTVRTTVRLRLDLLKEIHLAPNKIEACNALATQYVGRRGFSAKSILRHYYRYIATGDWRELVDKTALGHAWREARVKLPLEFVTHWKRIAEQNQRKAKPAYRALIRQWSRWRNGDPAAAIPGYDQPPEPLGQTGIPAGWTYRNLCRSLPGAIELAAARVGPQAVAVFRLPVLTTRIGLRVGEYVQFDDHEFNIKINFPGQSRAMRPRMFAALDIYSACDFCQGFKPTLWDEAQERKAQLKEDDFRWFVIHLLLTYGYRADVGTTFVVEHGTAAIRSQFESTIAQVTNGKVRVERSGKFSEAVLAGLFPGQVRGNFRFKAARESIFNLIDNEFAMLPGQTGLDRANAPEELAGRDVYNNKLVQAASLLPPERAALLQMPFMSWDRWLQAALGIFDLINARTDHDLEGWDKCGHIVEEWRLNEQSEWIPQPALLALPDEERRIASALVKARPNLTRCRKLSPKEVWDSGRAGLTKLPLPCLVDLADESDAIEATVRHGLFEFDRAWLGGAQIYLALIDDRPLPEGEKFQLWLDPFDGAQAVVTDAQGRILGTCPRYTRAARNNPNEIRHLMGLARHWEAQALAALKARHRDLIQDRAAMHAHNAAVITGEPVTDAERDRAMRDRQAATFGRDLLQQTTQQPTEPETIEL